MMGPSNLVSEAQFVWRVAVLEDLGRAVREGEAVLGLNPPVVVEPRLDQGAACALLDRTARSATPLVWGR